MVFELIYHEIFFLKNVTIKNFDVISLLFLVSLKKIINKSFILFKSLIVSDISYFLNVFTYTFVFRTFSFEKNFGLDRFNLQFTIYNLPFFISIRNF